MYAELADPSFGDYLLATLLSCRSQRMQRRMLYEIVSARYKNNQSSYRNTLSRLQKSGYIRYDKETVMLADRKFVTDHLLPTIHRQHVDTSTQFVIMFDIPERIRGMRYWIRSQLKLWGFTMMQKSVWVGYGPLPDEFVQEIKRHKLQKFVKVMQMKNVHLVKL